MAARTAAELVVDVVTDATKATAGFDAVGSSAGSMERSIKSAGDTAEKTGRQIGISADAADELGGKAGKATGALGALSSGFELVGAEKYASALQGAGLATDFMSGVGDSLNLVMESTAVKTVLAKAAMVGHAVASGASAAATSVMTAAQWALNAALSANPVALIVLGVLALVAAVVLAYNKSETFRRIVDAAFRAVQSAAAFAFNWVRDNWPLLLAIITGPIGLAVLAVVKNWDSIKTAVSAVKDFIKTTMDAVPGAISGAMSTLKSTLMAPFNAVKDAIEWILDKLSKIKVPNIPGLRVAGGAGAAPVLAGTSSTSTTITHHTVVNHVTITGILDADDAATTIRNLLDSQARLMGMAT